MDTVPCKGCAKPTPMLGTKLCDGCWEAQRHEAAHWVAHDARMEAARKWNVHCTVRGGVTGHREALLKQGGTIAVFDTEEAATAEAQRLNVTMNAPPTTGARFSYRAVPA